MRKTIKNKNYLVKTIRIELQYVIMVPPPLSQPNLFVWLTYQFLTSKYTNWCRTSPPVAFAVLVQWSYGKKTTHVMYYRHGGLHRRSIETKSAYYGTCRWIGGIHSYHSSSFFKQLSFIPFHFSHLLETATLLQIS